MSKRSRTKGHSFERWVARVLRTIWPHAKRGYQTRGGGKEQCDVEETPFHIECKHMKRVNVQAAMKQAMADSAGRPPVVIHKDDRSPVLVTMEMDTFLALARGEIE